MCDSTSDESDGAGLDGDGEASDEDRRYMDEAKAVAMNSPDEQTKVSNDLQVTTNKSHDFKNRGQRLSL